MGEGMKEVREAGGPWTVAGDPQEGGKMGVLVVKCEVFGVGKGWGGGCKINTNVQMDRDEGKVQEIG